MRKWGFLCKSEKQVIEDMGYVLLLKDKWNEGIHRYRGEINTHI